MSKAPSQRKFPWLRVLLGVPLVLILLLLVAAAICEHRGWPFLREPLQRIASEQLKREVRIAEPFQLKLLGSVRLRVGGLWIAAPQGFVDAPHLLDSGSVYLELRYRDLYQLRYNDLLRIKTLDVAQLDTRLIRHEDGTASWDFEQEKKENEPAKPLPVIEELIARQGHAEVIDPANQVNLKLDFSTDEGSASQHAASRIAAKGQFQHKPLQAELSTDGFLPIATYDDRTQVVRSRGWISYAKLRLDFDGAISDLLGKRNVKGSFTASGPSLSVLGDLTNSVLPVTDKFRLSGQLNKSDEVWNIDISSARIASSSLGGSFRFDPRPEPPSLSGELHGKRLVLADLAPAFGTRNEDGTAVKPPPGKIFVDRPMDMPSLNKMDADIKVRLDYVDLGNAFAKPISPFHADLSMERGKLAISNIDARTADGALAGLMSVDAYQENPDQPDKTPPRWRMDLQWKNIDLEKWLSVSQDRKKEAKREGEEVPPAYVTGTLNGRTRLDGKGKSTHELLSSLNGDVSMFIRKGTVSHLLIELMGIDLAQSLGILVKGDQSLAMQCAVMDFTSERGLVKPRVALIDTDVTTVLIDGKASLANETMDLRLTAKPKNISLFTLRSPIHVSGTFAEPKVRPETGPIAARVAGSIALAFLNPLAALLPFLDPGSSSDAPSPCHNTLPQITKPSR